MDIEHSHLSDQILLLGYPVNRLQKENLEIVIEELLKKYSDERIPQFITTISALLIGQLSTCSLNQRTNPEVVQCLRNANFVGLDSEGLQFLTKLLGNGVENLIQGEDLLLAAASYLSKYQGSIYLLGGDEALNKKVALGIKQDFPGLRLAGVSSPSIFTKGDRIEESLEIDPIIVDTINQTKPTILALQLGHPKQEIWFERIKNSLNVPLCIGIAGAFERYVQREEKKPKRESLAWHKIRRRFVSALHYACWIPPLFLFNTLNRLCADVKNKFSPHKTEKRLLFLSEKESLSSLTLPSLFDSSWKTQMLGWFEEALEHDNILIDFSEVRHMDLSGLGMLHQIIRRSQETHSNLFILGMKPDVNWLLHLHGAWDFIAPHVCQTPDDVLDRMSTNLGISLKNEREFISIQQVEQKTIVSFFGKLTGLHASNESWRQVGSILEGRNCLFDLTYCTGITNEGFGFLLKMRSLSNRQKLKLTLKVTRNLKRQFKNSKLMNLFKFD